MVRLCAERQKLYAKQREVFEAFFHGVAGIFCSGDLNDSRGTRDGSTDSRPCSLRPTLAKLESGTLGLEFCQFCTGFFAFYSPMMRACSKDLRKTGNREKERQRKDMPQ